MPSRSLLSITGLTVIRDRTTLLTDVAWRVERGEHWVILGPNGCGKTLLLKALTGYLTPSTGEIKLLGRRYGESDWRELRKRIGIVLADSGKRQIEQLTDSGRAAKEDCERRTRGRAHCRQGRQ